MREANFSLVSEFGDAIDYLGCGERGIDAIHRRMGCSKGDEELAFSMFATPKKGQETLCQYFNNVPITLCYSSVLRL